jgi:hypothetical protein
MPFGWAYLMSPEQWEAFAAMEGIPVLTDVHKECCICGEDIDKNEIYLEFMDLKAAVHISCADRLTAELEEKIFNE